MTTEDSSKTPHKKDAQYMRKAYIYTAILFVVGITGSLLLANRIITAENANQQIEAEEDVDAEQTGEGTVEP